MAVEAHQIKALLRDFLVDQGTWFGDRDALRDDESLIGSVIDSVGLVNLVAMLEDEFAFEVREQDLEWENFGSIDRIVAFVQRTAPAG
jgi:acyl carrier protein